jgi:hypothetical protein
MTNETNPTETPETIDAETIAEMAHDETVAEMAAEANLDAQILARFAAERSGRGVDGWETF